MAGDPVGVEAQPVEGGGVGSGRPRRRPTSAALASRTGVRPLLEQVGGPQQGLVAGGRRGPGQQPAAARGRRPSSIIVSVGSWHRVSVLPRACPTAGVRPPARPGQSSTTRSSRWTTSGDASSGSSSDRAPAHVGHRGGAWPHQPLGEDVAVGAGDLHGVVDGELAPDGHHPGRQQRPAPLDQGPAGPGVDHEVPAAPDGEGDPQLAGRQPPAPGPEACAHAGRRPGHGGQDPGPGGVGDDRLHPRPHGDLGRGQLRAPSPRSPPSCPGPPAMRSSSWSISTTSSMSDAPPSCAGSSVSRPAVSVSSTSSSAPTRWATSAASRSLSPKRISSSATASFSLTTGTTPELQQPGQGLAGVEVLAPVHEVERGQQDLARRQAVRLEGRRSTPA